MDGSDQHRCSIFTLKPVRDREDPPILIEFQQTGSITTTPLHSDSSGMSMACPDTHFWCLDKNYCLPVFVRCNGAYDCPDHEDEKGCDVYTCPGFYRCRASKVCVHVNHVCDGWPLCPQHDDELLCGQQCPPQCTCHGLAFFCSQVFAARQFPDLRYLDVRGSGMNVHQLGNNHILIHLSLARCGVSAANHFIFGNLHSLDLSDNLLTELSGYHFENMSQLTVLFLAGNPLNSVFNSHTGFSIKLNKVNLLDLSRLKIRSVDPSFFLYFPTLRFLNLSNSFMEMLQWNSAHQPVTSLQELDLRGCVISEFPRHLLRGFLHLQLLSTDNFKLCCSSMLPPGFNLNHCYVTPDEVSSCDNLLGSITYRSVFAILVTLALLGNGVSLILRVCIRRTWQQSKSSMVLTHLSVADLGMGLYLATLGLADRLLAGHYVWQDDTWRRGPVCHLAGVLALACRHATTFFIASLTLVQCLHRCPSLTRCLTPAKVKIICMVIWAASLVLATVPLVSQWRLLGQQALCVPLPHKQRNTIGSHYTYGVQVLLHFVLFVLCCACEAVSAVWGIVTESGMLSRDPYPSDSHYVLLASLFSGFLYTIACLVPTDSHTDRQAATHTALVYFGSVVSCAMNPYLHLYGVRVERSKRIKGERLRRILNKTRA